MAGPRRKSTRERLMEQVQPNPETGCWVWTGRTHRNGSPQMKVWDEDKGRWVEAFAARVAWEIQHGPVPAGKHIRPHGCSVKACVAPDHHRPGAAGNEGGPPAPYRRRGTALQETAQAAGCEAHAGRLHPEDIDAIVTRVTAAVAVMLANR